MQPPKTPTSFLDALSQPGNGGVFPRFCALYADLLLRWVRRFRFPGRDPLDLTHEVLVHLSEVLCRYPRREDGKFHRWLYTVAYRRCIDYCRRHPLGPGLDQAPEPAAEPVIDEAVEAEYRAHIAARVRELAREQFTDQTWDAFVELDLKGRSGQEVADALSMTRSAVYQAARRVRCWLLTLEGLLD